MAKTWQNLIDDCRTSLQDTRAPYRYSNAILLSTLNQALQELGRIRPDAFWDRFVSEDIVIPEVVETDADPDTDADTVTSPEDDEVALTDLVSTDLPMQFYNPLLFYVVGRTELIDDEFASDGRAMALLTNFKTTVLGM